MTLLRELGIIPGAILKFRMHQKFLSYCWDQTPDPAKLGYKIPDIRPDPVAGIEHPQLR
jgi:hypothetical protein